jgi:hypothetical protein
VVAPTRRPSLTKKKKPTVRVTSKAKSEYYIAKKNAGEPTFTSDVITNLEHGMNLSWYNSMYGTADAKSFLLTYLKNSVRDADHKRIKDVPDKWICTTSGWIARMRSLGANLPANALTFFETRLKLMLERDYSKARMEVTNPEGITHQDKPKPSQKPSVQDRIKAKADHLISDIEETIDNFHNGGYQSSFELYEHLKKIEATPLQAKAIFDFYDPQLTEIEMAYLKTDSKVVEGYAGYTAKQLESLYDFYVMIVEDAERYNQNEKKARKPRTPKPVSVEKKLQHFKYQPTDVANKLQSIRPDSILGAGELWAFSTKYNQLSVFRMASPAGLDINRTAIANHDPATSFTKKLKAKDVASVLDQVLKGGKISLRKLMSEINGSEQKLQERMNENTILLRVVPK